MFFRLLRTSLDLFSYDTAAEVGLHTRTNYARADYLSRSK